MTLTYNGHSIRVTSVTATSVTTPLLTKYRVTVTGT